MNNKSLILGSLFALAFSLGSASSIFSKSHKQDGTCAGICDTQGVHPDWPCQCNVFCVQFGDCCPDYETACLSCADRCNSAFNANLPCQCTTQCQNFNDCCADYGDVCDGGQPEPGTVTNAEIIQLVDDMSAVDFNNMASGITFDLQSSTTGSDTSPNPLFPEEIPEVYLQIPTVAALLNLFDNYHPLVSIQESFTPEQESEIEVFLDAVFDTEVFRVMTDFFLAKEIFDSQESLRAKLKEVWFNRYCRDAKDADDHPLQPKCNEGSSGFEHVFLGEQKSNSISGVHGWIYLALQEQAGNINYFGHMTTRTFGDKGSAIEFAFTWDGLKKPISSVFVGASPELDLASLSVCFLLRPNSLCSVSISGVGVKIQTYTEAYNGQQLVGTAYYDVSS